jgi:hypothetical protein
MTNRTTHACTLLAGLMLVLGAAAASAQQPTTQPAATQPAGATAIQARVLQVRGEVSHAPLGSDEWTPCAEEDTYPPETVIRTGVRSSVTLQIGDDDTYTAVVIESASQVILSELNRTSQTKRVRIGVGYGKIRAGVVEGGLESDFVVDSPVATLSKRGTWDFGLFYERATDRFEIFLLDQGLVDAFDRINRERRTVLPREVVTQAMRSWAAESSLRRNVPIPDIFGQGDIEIAFNRLRQDGLRVIDPEGGRSAFVDLASAPAAAQFANILQQTLPTTRTTPLNQRPIEGFFGTGRGDELIPIVITPSSELAKNRFAQPGTYKFRRSVLETWLRNYQSRR